MSSERERLLLHDVVDNIDSIDAYLDGVSLAAFGGDQMRVDAVERCVQRLTEAVIKIGAERMPVIAPYIPVHEVRGLGNVLRHEYGNIDLATIYRTATDKLPGLRTDCLRALGDDPN